MTKSMQELVQQQFKIVAARLKSGKYNIPERDELRRRYEELSEMVVE